jgi:enoyl-[acyl-carrier protein] reductase II
MDASVANTGQVAGRIEDIAPAADIIKRMWSGCRQALAETADRLGPVTTDGF